MLWSAVSGLYSSMLISVFMSCSWDSSAPGPHPPALHAAHGICTAVCSLARSTRPGDPPLGISAAAFVGLLEAAVVLGCAGMTALHNLILPRSLALAYMGSRPEDARLYDALLQPCFQPADRYAAQEQPLHDAVELREGSTGVSRFPRHLSAALGVLTACFVVDRRKPGYMATQLADAVGIAADVLTDGRKAARKWLNGGREPVSDASSAAAHAARLLNVIAAAVVNCKSQHSRRSISQLVGSMTSGPYDLVPEPFQEMLIAFGSARQPVPLPAVGEALQRALTAGGDSLVVLYRPSSYELKKSPAMG